MHRSLLLLSLAALVACESRRPAGAPQSSSDASDSKPAVPVPVNAPPSDDPPGWPADAGSANPAAPPVQEPRPLPTTTPPNGFAK